MCSGIGQRVIFYLTHFWFFLEIYSIETTYCWCPIIIESRIVFIDLLLLQSNFTTGIQIWHRGQIQPFNSAIISGVFRDLWLIGGQLSYSSITLSEFRLYQDAYSDVLSHSQQKSSHPSVLKTRVSMSLNNRQICVHAAREERTPLLLSNKICANPLLLLSSEWLVLFLCLGDNGWMI